MNGNHPFLAQIVFSVYLKGCFSRCQNVRSIYLVRTKIPRMYRKGSLNFFCHRALGDSDDYYGPSLQKIHVDRCTHFHRWFRGSQILWSPSMNLWLRTPDTDRSHASPSTSLLNGLGLQVIHPSITHWFIFHSYTHRSSNHSFWLHAFVYRWRRHANHGSLFINPF